MLPGLRSFNKADSTLRMVGNFPSWMKIRRPESVGFQFLEAVAGSEFDLLNRTLDLYSSYLLPSTAPNKSPTRFYEIQLDNLPPTGNIKALAIGNNGSIYRCEYPIYLIEDPTIFLSNPPTRMELTQRIFPSGLVSGIASLEFFYASPTGYLVVRDNSDTIDASSVLFYPVDDQNNLLTLYPISGKCIGLGYVGLGENNLYEIVKPESETVLKRLYPTGVWVFPSGDYLAFHESDFGLVPSGFYYANQSYINKDGEKVYYYAGLNNPYGYNKYNVSHIPLKYDPVESSIKVVDLMYLTASGTPTEIPSSGLFVYEKLLSGQVGTFIYRGYDPGIPERLLPRDIWLSNLGPDGRYVAISGCTILHNTAWRMLPSSGYLDDEVYPHSGSFNYIYGEGPINNIIEFSGGNSTYQVEYSYKQYNSIAGLSSDSKSIDGLSNQDGSLLFVDSEEDWVKFNPETSRSNDKAIRLSPLELRPGTTAKITLEVNSKWKDYWVSPSGTNKTILLKNHNIGFSDDFSGY